MYLSTFFPKLFKFLKYKLKLFLIGIVSKILSLNEKFKSLIILDFTLFVLSKILSPLEVKPKEPNLVDNEFCE